MIKFTVVLVGAEKDPKKKHALGIQEKDGAITGWFGWLKYDPTLRAPGRNTPGEPVTHWSPESTEKFARQSEDAWQVRRASINVIYANYISHEQLWHGLFGKIDAVLASSDKPPYPLGAGILVVDSLRQITDEDCKRLKESLKVK
ncbi:MAG TPA: hypothetical protein VNA25_09895 [Phycisphaerae bacterium]|nr:hypothetical protein [Phycisphaerae bacterium]